MRCGTIGSCQSAATSDCKALVVTSLTHVSKCPDLYLLLWPTYGSKDLAACRREESRVDSCNTVLAGSLKIVTDSVQCILNAAAHVVSQTRKVDCVLTRLLHIELHWLDVPERVQYKLGVSDCSAVHAAQGSTMSGRLLHAVLRHRQSSTSSLRQPPSARRATTLPELVRSSGLLRRRPHRLELATSSPPWPVAEFRFLQNGSENSSLHGVPVTLAH